MSVVKIMLELGPPTQCGPSSSIRKNELGDKPTIEQQVRDMLQLIESDYESSIEWRALRGLYAKLMSMKQSDRVKNLRKMIKPVLHKYGHLVD